MKKLFGWTLIELMVAITIVVTLSLALLINNRPSVQKSKIYLYAAVNNIMKANIGILDRYEKFSYAGELFRQNPTDTTNNLNTYCVQFADILSLKSAASCANNSSASTTNVSLTNGIEIRGLASAAITPYTNSEFTYKNILVDIDGFGSGLNRIWVDRFPLVIFSGGEFTGNVKPANCNSTVNMYKPDGTAASQTRSAYCGTTNVNYEKDNSLLSYDIYTYEINEDNIDAFTKGTLIAGMQSPFDADCKAFGGHGIYQSKACQNASVKIHEKCANEFSCEGCNSYSLCAGATATAADCTALNPSNSRCAVKVHKPSSGMNIMLKAIIGDIDEL